ncbi:hypothetical protein RND71_017389 [Anisodus tanguticus]|uniref:Uncharacterized protein n=1 Tax=Anisodus tanguticus TaxID=243964 RepID=A0AAE1S3N6_9SOLA|nr:hypothetical protein RND71_017389 [Anisodus tanguticus]
MGGAVPLDMREKVTLYPIRLIESIGAYYNPRNAITLFLNVSDLHLLFSYVYDFKFLFGDALQGKELVVSHKLEDLFVSSRGEYETGNLAGGSVGQRIGIRSLQPDLSHRLDPTPARSEPPMVAGDRRWSSG